MNYTYTPIGLDDRRQIIPAIIATARRVKNPMAVTVSCSSKPISRPSVDLADHVVANQIIMYTHL